MQVFISGTDTNIGKTLVASWLCLHSGYDYFKPIQTGYLEGKDSTLVSALAGNKIHSEIYNFKDPVSPHLAARLENKEININEINLPNVPNIIIEGAGGLLVPLNEKLLMIDLIKHLSIPIILVAGTQLGTINHTLLSLEALRIRSIEILGIIINGKLNQHTIDTIEFYGKEKTLAHLPYMDLINRDTLSKILLPQYLQKLLKIQS